MRRRLSLNYTRDEFSKMRYNTFELRKGDDVKFGDLISYPIFNVKILNTDIALLFKWITYMYDAHSPMTNIADIRKRGLIAAAECGFPKNNNGKLASGYKEVAMFDREIMVDLGKKIVQYCRLQRDSDYLQLAVYELRRLMNNELIIDPTTETKESLDLIKSQGMLGISIDELRIKFLNGDSSDKTYSEVLDSIENDNMEFTPEQILLNDKIRKSVMDLKLYGEYYNVKKKYRREDLTDEEEAELQEELVNNTKECKTHFESLGINYEISSSK